MSKSARGYRGTGILVVLCLLLVFVISATMWGANRTAPGGVNGSSSPAPQYLSTQGPNQPKPFNPADVPGWLFVHVGIIAGLQVLALVGAVVEAGRSRTARDARTVQFLVEVPMYLGLFGTLLGVCLTQFVTGALTAPLAYLTTMSGIVLHVLGKLTILLPLPNFSGEAE